MCVCVPPVGSSLMDKLINGPLKEEKKGCSTRLLLVEDIICLGQFVSVLFSILCSAINYQSEVVLLPRVRNFQVMVCPCITIGWTCWNTTSQFYLFVFLLMVNIFKPCTDWIKRVMDVTRGILLVIIFVFVFCFCHFSEAYTIS